VKPKQIRIELFSGRNRAVFLHDGAGWQPDWIYEGRRRLLRFKDHEWLSLGRVVCVTRARRAAKVGNGWVFSGTERVLDCSVAWSVTVAPAEEGFFRVRSEIQPCESIELVEALTTFETPYDYDGSETSETVIGANPATVWDGRQVKTAHFWRNPAWCYRRQEAAYYTYECHLPVLVHRVRKADGSGQICTSILGNFNVCDWRDLFVQPTRTVFKDSADYGDMKRGTTRGYKFIVGALNWSSSYPKDPNILVTPKGTRQEVLVSTSTRTPGGSMDAWLVHCWGVSNRLHGNDGTRLPVSRVYARQGASWKKAGAWLQKSLVHPGSTAMVHPEKGPQDYVIGTRPLANWCYGKIWGHYLRKNILATLYYRAHVFGQPEERKALMELESSLLKRHFIRDPADPAKVADDQMAPYTELAALAPESVIGARARPQAVGNLRAAIRRVMSNPDLPPGVQARRLNDLTAAMVKPHFDRVWRTPLRAIADALEHNYWEFGYMPRSKMHINGGQTAVSSLFIGAELFAKAYVVSGDDEFARGYARFVNLAIGWGYHTFNGDTAEDFDFRGLAHASVAGRDQLADVPPMENSSFADTLGWLDVIPSEYYRTEWFDCLWMGMQTGLCQYPAVRTTKRLWTPGYGRTIEPLRKIATERHLQKHLPYMAYENPYDQTLVATYQSLQGLVADLFFGGALADAGPNVLCLVPRAARLDRAEIHERKILLYNPRDVAQTARPRAFFPAGTATGRKVRLKPHALQWVTLRPPASEGTRHDA
jgi:hypothetical protein